MKAVNIMLLCYIPTHLLFFAKVMFIHFSKNIATCCVYYTSHNNNNNSTINCITSGQNSIRSQNIISVRISFPPFPCSSPRAYQQLHHRWLEDLLMVWHDSRPGTAQSLPPSPHWQHSRWRSGLLVQLSWRRRAVRGWLSLSTRDFA